VTRLFITETVQYEIVNDGDAFDTMKAFLANPNKYLVAVTARHVEPLELQDDEDEITAHQRIADAELSS
jgi:hypothetical protein